LTVIDRRGKAAAAADSVTISFCPPPLTLTCIAELAVLTLHSVLGICTGLQETLTPSHAKFPPKYNAPAPFRIDTNAVFASGDPVWIAEAEAEVEGMNIHIYGSVFMYLPILDA
jgi:hypothetical protein